MKTTIMLAAACSLLLGAIYLTYSPQDAPGIDLDDHVGTTAIATLYEKSELKSLLAIKDNSERDLRLQQFFTPHIQMDPEVALHMIGQLDRSQDRQFGYKAALSVWYIEDVAALSDWLENQNPDPDLDLALFNLSEIGSDDTDLSLLFSEKISDELMQKNAITALFDNWTLVQRKQMILWSIERNQDRDEWLALAFEVLSVDSLTNAITTLSILETGSAEQLYIAIQTIIDHYEIGLIDAEVLIAMQSLTPYEIREDVIGALLPLFVHEEGLTLDDLDTLLGSLLPGPVRDSYQEQVVFNWAIKDPLEAAEYAQSLTGNTRSLAVNAVVDSWMRADLESTDAWLKTLDGDLDLAANTLGRGSAELGNIQIADNWINYIEDEQMRTEAIVDVVKGWYDVSAESGIYHLVFQKSLTVQQKLGLLHEIYPDEVFITPTDALDDIGRLEGLQITQGDTAENY